MIRLWGAEKYGLFALSSSLFVSLALLDGGVRSLTRVRLAPLLAEGKTEDAMRTLIHGLLAFMIVCGFALLIALGLCANDFLSHILHLPPGGQTVLLISGILTSFWMTSLLALPACSVCLFLGAGPLITMGAMILCLIIPNLLLLFRNLPRKSLHLWSKSFPIREALTTLVHGFPYYLTTIALIGKTHGLTFLISAMAGPAEAGIFYILLRLSETLSNVASTSSETSVATLAFDTTRSQRILLFRQSWTWVLLFSLHGALALTLIAPTLWNWWLPSFSSPPPMVWPALALFGWMGGWSQMTTNSSMGLGLIQSAAVVCLTEAVLTIVLAYLGFLHGGFAGLFFGGAMAGLVTGFQSVRITKSLQEPFLRLWLHPLRELMPGLLLSGLILLGASLVHTPWVCILALLIPAALVLWQMKQLSKAP